jgi:hypothetical protein
MTTETADELCEFHRFLSDKVTGEGRRLSPEDALDEWRTANPAADDLAAIQESLDDMAKGDRGTPFADFDREFQKRHGFLA